MRTGTITTEVKWAKETRVFSGGVAHKASSDAMTQTTYSSYAYLMRSLRQERGLTVEQLAERAGVSPMTVRRIERGGYLPSVTTAYMLAYALGDELRIGFISKRN